VRRSRLIIARAWRGCLSGARLTAALVM